MSSLRLLSDTTASSVTSVSITDVFTTDFDIYKITTYQEGFSGNTSIDARFINSNGQIVTASNYDLARMLQKADGTFTQERTHTNADFRSFGEADDDGSASLSYIFNPMNSSSYTSIINQNASGRGYMMKGIAILKQMTQIAGIEFFSDNGGTMTKFQCKIYGLRSS